MKNKLKTNIESKINDLIDEYLSDNCRIISQYEPYGDTMAIVDNSYSDDDYDRAYNYAIENIANDDDVQHEIIVESGVDEYDNANYQEALKIINQILN